MSGRDRRALAPITCAAAAAHAGMPRQIEHDASCRSSGSRSRAPRRRSRGRAAARRAPREAARRRGVEHLHANAHAVGRTRGWRRRRTRAGNDAASRRHAWRTMHPRAPRSRRRSSSTARGDEKRIASSDGVPAARRPADRAASLRAATTRAERARPGGTSRRSRAAPARRGTRGRRARTCGPARGSRPCRARGPAVPTRPSQPCGGESASSSSLARSPSRRRRSAAAGPCSISTV